MEATDLSVCWSSSMARPFRVASRMVPKSVPLWASRRCRLRAETYGVTFDGTQLGDWQLADDQGTITVSLPDTRGGADTFAVHAADGSVLGWSIVKLR